MKKKKGERKVSKSAADDEKETGTRICTLICLGLIEVGLGIWGGIELFDKSCSNLENTKLWTFGLVTFILQMICCGLIFVITPLTVAILAFLDKPSSGERSSQSGSQVDNLSTSVNQVNDLESQSHIDNNGQSLDISQIQNLDNININ